MERVDADYPNSLGTESGRAARRALLGGDHVAPLTDFVRRIRLETGRGEDVPFFDQLDGGTRARCLYLLEAPGARAVSSGFISRNNPDESARNFLDLNVEAEIARERTAIWNVVPWYIGSGTKIRPAGRADIAAGLPWLERLLRLLPRLRVVVLMGSKAAVAEPLIRAAGLELQVVKSPHPSPLFVNNRPGNRQKIADALRSVAEIQREVI